jgi:hypothetical protein
MKVLALGLTSTGGAVSEPVWWQSRSSSETAVGWSGQELAPLVERAV